MMLVPAGVRVHIALGVTDMRKGLDGLGRWCLLVAGAIAGAAGRACICVDQAVR